MRVAYADPPYPGQAHRYKNHPDYAGEVDHAALVRELVAEFPDGWALSTSSTALKDVLAVCPDGVRISAWCKSFGVFKPNVNPAYVWEPVIWCGGRQPRDRSEPTVRDWVVCPITLRRGLVGVKPDSFCFWLFDLLGLCPGDELVDLFPGSGAVTWAWQKWQRQLFPSSADVVGA